MRARSFVRDCGIDAVPVDLKKYLEKANAELRVSDRLSAGAAGDTMYVHGRHIITVNGKDTPERQRFTVMHEIGHIVLELPSKHGDAVSSNELYSYVRRPPEEVLCDTFAAECLVPHQFLLADLKSVEAHFGFIEKVAEKYGASLACTASRVVTSAPIACAYVLSQEGYVRFTCYSPLMRQGRFWISPGIEVPRESATAHCFRTGAGNDTRTVPGYLWTSRDEYADVDLKEDVRVMASWGQGLTLLSLDSGDGPDLSRRPARDADEDDEPLLRELDGTLPWPSGKKRR